MNAPVELTLGQLAKMAFDVREEKRALDRESKECGNRLNELKELIHAKLVEQGVEKTAVDGISVSLADKQVPTVEDWDAVYAFIKERDMPFLLERRMSSATWKELLEQGDEVPGVVSFTKMDVNLRAT